MFTIIIYKNNLNKFLIKNQTLIIFEQKDGELFNITSKIFYNKDAKLLIDSIKFIKSLGIFVLPTGGISLKSTEVLDAEKVRNILDQAKKGWNYEYKKVYFVGLLNYVHFHNRTQPFTKVMLQTTDDHIVTNYNYLQIFVELPKLAELIDDSTPDNEAFLCALRDIGKEDERPTRYARKSLDNLFSLSRYQKLKEEEKAKLEEEKRLKIVKYSIKNILIN